MEREQVIFLSPRLDVPERGTGSGFDDLAYRTGTEMAVPLDRQPEGSPDLPQLAEGERSPLGLDAFDVPEEDEVVTLGRAFRGVPRPARVRCEEFHVCDRVRRVRLAAERRQPGEDLVRE